MKKSLLCRMIYDIMITNIERDIKAEGHTNARMKKEGGIVEI